MKANICYHFKHKDTCFIVILNVLCSVSQKILRMCQFACYTKESFKTYKHIAHYNETFLRDEIDVLTAEIDVLAFS